MQDMPHSIYDPASDRYWLDVKRYYSIDYSSYRMPGLHRHRELEIMYVADGKCTVRLEGGELTLRGGEYIFLDGMAAHSLIAEDSQPCRIFNLEAGIERAKSFLRLEILSGDETFRNFRKAGLPSFLCQDSAMVIHNGLVGLQRLMQQQATPMEIGMQLSLILLEISRHYFISRKNKPAGTPFYIKTAMTFIGQNFDQDITINDIAAAAGVSRSHLQRAFRKYADCTIVEKINSLRLEKARFLLETSPIPVIDVANAVGFGSRQYFTDLFTRSTGYSPASYRKRRGGNMAEGHDFDLPP